MNISVNFKAIKSSFVSFMFAHEYQNRIKVTFFRKTRISYLTSMNILSGKNNDNNNDE